MIVNYSLIGKIYQKKTYKTAYVSTTKSMYEILVPANNRKDLYHHIYQLLTWLDRWFSKMAHTVVFSTYVLFFTVLEIVKMWWCFQFLQCFLYFEFFSTQNDTDPRQLHIQNYEDLQLEEGTSVAKPESL